MTMIKSKTTSDKDIVPKVVNVGEPAFVRSGDGWIKNDGSGKIVKVETKSLKEVLEFLKQKNLSKAHA